MSGLDIAGLTVAGVEILASFAFAIAEHCKAKGRNKQNFEECVKKFEKLRTTLTRLERSLKEVMEILDKCTFGQVESDIDEAEREMDKCVDKLLSIHSQYFRKLQSPAVFYDAVIKGFRKVDKKIREVEEYLSSSTDLSTRDVRKAAIEYLDHAAGHLDAFLREMRSSDSASKIVGENDFSGILQKLETAVESAKLEFDNATNKLYGFPQSTGNLNWDRNPAIQKIQDASKVCQCLIKDQKSTSSAASSKHRISRSFKSMFKAVDTETALREVQEILEKVETSLGNNVMHLGIVKLSAPEHRIDDQNLVLNYSKDQNTKKYTTFEGKLKGLVLGDFDAVEGEGEQDPSALICAAIGKNKLNSVLGMGGVGKTTALIGLASDSEVKEHFVDGIFTVRLGRQITARNVIEQIAEMMLFRKTERTKILGAQSVPDAVRSAQPHFAKKRCLLLFDDLWNTDASCDGFLGELSRLLDNSPNSRIAISTRDNEIAGNNKVCFDTRDPTGEISKNILFKSAKISKCAGKWSWFSRNIADREYVAAFERVLIVCGGLPIALAVAGSEILSRWRSKKSVDLLRTLREYAEEIEQNKIKFAKTESGEIKYESSLFAAIQASLDSLEQQESSSNGAGLSNSVSRMSAVDRFHALSVLKNQAFAPLSMLSRLWGVSEGPTSNVDSVMEKTKGIAKMLSDRSLVTTCSREVNRGQRAVQGIMVHDLVLDVCRDLAGEKCSSWHECVVDGYAMDLCDTETESSAQALPPSGEGWNRSLRRASVDLRPWYNEAIENDGYLYENLTWHLDGAGKLYELSRLLLDVRWSTLRVKIGGILSLKNDFDILVAALDKKKSASGAQASGIECNLILPVKMIFKALRCGWCRIRAHPKTISFEMFGRLLDLSQEMSLVKSFLRNVEDCAVAPWLCPLSQCLANPKDALDLETSFEGSSVHGCTPLDVAFFPCGSLVAVAIGDDIVVVQTASGNILKQYRGHESSTTSVVVCYGGRRIVSGSDDSNICVWEYETEKLAFPPLWEHKSRVESLSVTPNSLWMASGHYDGTICVWETHEHKFELWDTLRGHSDAVSSVALSSNGDFLVSGSHDGKILLWRRAETNFVKKEVYSGSPISGVALSVDGCKMVAAEHDSDIIRCWDIISPTPGSESEENTTLSHSDIHSWRFEELWHNKVKGGRSVVVSPDGRFVICGCLIGVEVLEMANGQLKKRFGGVKAINYGVAVSHDLSKAASVYFDHTLRLWDYESAIESQAPSNAQSPSDVDGGNDDDVQVRLLQSWIEEGSKSGREVNCNPSTICEVKNIWNVKKDYVCNALDGSSNRVVLTTMIAPFPMSCFELKYDKYTRTFKGRITPSAPKTQFICVQSKGTSVFDVIKRRRHLQSS